MMSKRKFISSVALLGLISSVSYAQHCVLKPDMNTSAMCLSQAHKSFVTLATTDLASASKEKCILGLGKFEDDTILSHAVCINNKKINGSAVYLDRASKTVTVELKGNVLDDKSSQGSWQVLSCTGQFFCDAP